LGSGSDRDEIHLVIVAIEEILLRSCLSNLRIEVKGGVILDGGKRYLEDSEKVTGA
jgi:hypothetical protein